MNSVEDQVRAATRAIASTVQALPPLSLPEPAPARVRRRWQLWAVPLTAATTVLAIGVATVAVSKVSNGHAVPRNAAESTVPEYFAALSGSAGEPASAIVGDTFTGRVIASVSPPSHSTFIGVTAAADDRTFVLEAQRWGGWLGLSPLSSLTWYLLRFRPGARHPVTLTKLPALAGQWVVNDIALSPDGAELAVITGFTAKVRTADRSQLGLWQIATGRLLRTWYTRAPIGGDGNDNSLFWIRGGPDLAITDHGHQVLLLNTTAPDGELLARASYLVRGLPAPNRHYPLSCPAWSTIYVTASGTRVLCGDIRSTKNPRTRSLCAPAPITELDFLEYSLPGPRFAGVLYSEHSDCPIYAESSDIFWANASGTTLIGDTFHVGVFTNGSFTPLRFPAQATQIVW
jgi:hypothetical protein